MSSSRELILNIRKKRQRSSFSRIGPANQIKKPVYSMAGENRTSFNLTCVIHSGLKTFTGSILVKLEVIAFELNLKILLPKA